MAIKVVKTKQPGGADESTATDVLPSVLTQIGLIATPASLIALFCGVLEVSAKSTAAVCLLSAVLTSICVYRKRVNRILPSSILTALLVALAGVFFFSYQNILLKDTGLIKWYKHSNDYLAEISREIDSSQQEIWFFGTDFHVTAGERREALLKKLSSGLKIRFLIFDPRSSHLEELAADFDQSPNELKSECEKGLEDLIELQKRWQLAARQTQNPGELEVRVFDVHPHERLYVFDPQRSQGRTYFVPYVNDLTSSGSPGYLLQNAQSGIFPSYFGGVRKLWARSETLQQHLQNAAAVH